MEFIKKAILQLKNKENSFIGSLKNDITVAESKGFKQGLAWAISSIESAIEEEKHNCFYKRVFSKLPNNRVEYISECGFQYIKVDGYEIGDSGETLNETIFPSGMCLKCKKQISN